MRRGLSPGAEEARGEIHAGRVLVGGAPATSPARLVARGEPIVLLGPPPRFVSRGGDKLEAALAAFPVPVEGCTALDVGASTGGFTDCLLQHGARHVVALDVGRNQLHERLRDDPRVTVVEQTDVRAVDVTALGGPFPVVVADLSFISLTTVAAALLTAASPGAHLVLLVKPQFEAERAEVSRGRGVVRDPEVWGRALRRVHATLVASGAAIMGAMASPLRGADGNVEFLLHVRAAGAPTDGLGAPLDGDAVAAVAAQVAVARG